MANAQVLAFIQALKQCTGASSDEQLAAELKVGKSTIGSWRIRGSVPNKVKLDALDRYRIDFDSLEVQDQTPSEVVQFLITSAEILSIMQLAHTLKEDELADYAMWLGENRLRLRSIVTDGLFFEAYCSENARVFTRLLTDVMTGKRATPSELRALKEADDQLTRSQPADEFRTGFRTDLKEAPASRSGSAPQRKKDVG